MDLPKPGERNPRQQIVEVLAEKGVLTPRNNGLIASMDKIGFAHISPEIQESSPSGIITHPYFKALKCASVNDDKKYALGLFINGELETRISISAIKENWNVLNSCGTKFHGDPKYPTLIFLGPQQQTTVSGLFLSSDIPNLVTGDLSLSDALYGLIAMDGPAFYYETPGWKAPTFNELFNIFGRVAPDLGNIFMFGSNFWEKY